MLEQLAQYHPNLPDIAAVLFLIITAWLAYLMTSRVLLAVVHRLAARTSATWDDAFIKNRVGRKLAQLVPVYVVYEGVGKLANINGKVEALVTNIASAYMIVVMVITVIAILSSANDIYESNPRARQRPIKGFIQLLQLAVVILGVLLFISALMDESPVLLLSGFGAMTAVLLLVFKDTLLSLVASVQLTAQDMVRVGDWIEVPQFGADGDVVDVELHTIKVQNWDKTITTIPTHRLISDSFKNWRGMSLSGGRRIKRALYLDASSVHFMSEQEIESCSRFFLLEEYLAEKRGELSEYNQSLGTEAKADSDIAVNMRRLTNIGTFRAYAERYLQCHPQIHKGMTLMVRQLPPGPQGIPIELYCFTTTTVWGDYEAIQADIFDHLLAIIPEFGLRLFQQPAGTEFTIHQL
ncbi:Miniconductance mechanosensitive channel YbdG [Halioglobus japonicus]|nr:Miniconductance mechanosensitive channel YbdG [Halioglobus japonicus]